MRQNHENISLARMPRRRLMQAKRRQQAKVTSRPDEQPPADAGGHTMAARLARQQRKDPAHRPAVAEVRCDRRRAALGPVELVSHVQRGRESHRHLARRQRVALVKRQIAVHRDHRGGHRHRRGEACNGASEDFHHVRARGVLHMLR